MTLTADIKQYINESAAIACKIEDKETRIKTYALNIAARAAAEVLNRLGFETDTKNSLFKITAFEKNFELADIYVNGCRLDIRITFDGNTFTIPKTHQKYDAVPYAYLVMALDENNGKAELIGYADTTKIEYNRTDSAYYTFNTGILSSVESLPEFLKSLKPENKTCFVDELEKVKGLCAAFLDDEISESEKVFFIKQVISCPDCRAAFCITSGFDLISAQIKNYNELLNDSTLSVLSGNKKEINEAVIANMSFVENAQEDEEQKETSDLSDIETSELTQSVSEEEPLLLQQEEAVLPMVLEEEQQNTIESDEAERHELLIEEEKEESLLLEEDSHEEILLNPISEDELLQGENDTDNQLLSETEIIKEDFNGEDLSDNLLLQEEETIEEHQTPEDIIQDDVTDVLKFADDEIIPSDGVSVINLESGETDTEINLQELPVEDEPLEHLIDADDNLLEITEDKEEDVLSFADDIQTEDKKEIPETLHTPEILQDMQDEELLPIEDDESEKIAEIDEIGLTVETEKNETLYPEPENFETLDTHETFDTEEILPEFQDETVEDYQPEITNEESISFSFDTSEENEESISHFRQEPVELNYDDEPDEELPASSNFDFTEDAVTESEPHVYSENISDSPDSIIGDIKQETENAEIQNLLDDDLMALLAENNGEESVNEAAFSPEDGNENIETQQYYEQEMQTEQTFADSGVNSDETINTLFENNEATVSENGDGQSFTLAQEPVSEDTVKKTKKLAVLAGLLVVMVAAGGATLVFNHQKAAQNKNYDAANQGDELFDFQNKGSSDEDKEASAVPQDINKSMTNSFSDKPAAITITKLLWNVNEKLAAEPAVVDYLQSAGKNIQMNLQNDLANSADIAFNNIVKISFEIAPDNTMKGMQILESSGSDKIDEIILRSIKNTLKYISVPKLKDYKSDYFLTLIINF